MKAYVLTDCYSWEGDFGINTEAYSTRPEAEKKQRELLHQYVDGWLYEGQKVVLGAEQMDSGALEASSHRIAFSASMHLATNLG